jgi:hypothetical protein
MIMIAKKFGTYIFPRTLGLSLGEVGFSMGIIMFMGRSLSCPKEKLKPFFPWRTIICSREELKLP